MSYSTAPTVAVIFNQKQIGSFLKRLPINKKDKNRYIDFSTEDLNTIRLLEERRFRKITKSEMNLNDPKMFIQDYITLIGAIGRKINNRLWWATDIASKNPLASRLPVLLEQFLFTLRVIEKQDFDCLIIFHPDWILLDLFRKTVHEKGVNFICFEYLVKIWFRLRLRIIKRIISSILTALAISFRIYFAKRMLRDKVENKINYEKSYYVIKTFIFNGSFDKNNKYKDIIFGTLPDFLKSKGNLIVLSSILGNYQYYIRKIKQESENIIFPLELFMSYSDVFKSLLEVIFCKISINRDAIFSGYNASDLISAELKRTNKGIPLNQYLQYNSTKNLCKKISVEEFLLTYENNQWEKMSILALREFSPNTSIIGYQHTIVAQAFASSFVSQHERNLMPLPDKILTVGEIPKNILEEYGEYENGLIESSCSLRYAYLFDVSRCKRRRSGNILLALDGVPEVSRMVNYVVGELKENHHYQLTIRPHPVLPLRKFQDKLKYNLGEISNINFSNNSSLVNDLTSSDIVIYWGSTIALEAINMGIPIIHYDMGSFLSFDPLFEFNHFKWIVTNRDSLVDKIEEIYSLDDSQFIREYKKAKEYICRYFHPVTEEKLEKFIYS